MRNRAIFLDKDGTLIENVPYNVDPQHIRLAPGAAEGLPRLRAAGFQLIAISNQSGVARGRFDERALEAVRARLGDLMGDVGAALDGFYYCPHHPEGTVARYAVECECRKPAPGLLLAAAREREIDLARSWFIGDILDDVETGRRAGCRTVLIENGNETEWRRSADRRPDFAATDLAAAAWLIVGETQAEMRTAADTKGGPGRRGDRRAAPRSRSTGERS